MTDKVVLCGANSYEQKYYFNEDFQVISEEGDYLFDEIGSVLKIKEYQETKKELLEALELYYRTFFLGENVDWGEEKEDQEGDDKGETDEV